MSLIHDPSCTCVICGDLRGLSIPMIQDDREHLAKAWDFWISSRDGESAKLRAGQDGNVGSPRWVALQAIAAARVAATDRAAGIAPAALPNPIASADTAAAASQARPDGDLRPGRSMSLDRGA